MFYEKSDTSNHGRPNNKNMDVGQPPTRQIKLFLIKHYQKLF